MKNKTLMKVLSALLAVMMVLCSAPLSGFVGLKFPEIEFSSLFDFSIKAEAEVMSGSCGATSADDVHWSIDMNGVLNITGTGDMKKYSISTNAPWFSYRSLIKSVNIANGVTSIGDYSFFDCENLISISISNSVVIIGDMAFLWCDSFRFFSVESNNPQYSNDEYGVLYNKCKTELIQYPAGSSRVSFVVPDSVTSIGESAFAFCESLIEVTISNNVISVGDNAFGFCGNLVSVTINGNVTSIGAAAFKNCTSLTTVNIPKSVTSIGDSAFYNCSSLEKVILPENLVSLGVHVFAKCEHLSEIVINCTNLKPINSTTCSHPFCSVGTETQGVKVVFADTVKAIPSGFLSGESIIGCYKPLGFNLKSVYIGVNVSVVGSYAFSYCDIDCLVFNARNCIFESADIWAGSSVANVTFGEDVNRIPEYFMFGFSETPDIDIPESVTSIGNKAFSGCSSITEITIPESVSEIGNYAFSNCENLENVIFLGKDGIYIGDNIFDYSPKATICCKENSYMHYYADMNVIRYCIIDEENNPNYEIKNEVLISYKGDAENIYLNSVSRVGYGAFGGNILLKQIELSSCIDRIYDRAFTECENLETIIIPKNVTSIGNNAFYGCDKLTIYCYAGSYAETYAKEQGIKYEYITLELTESKVEIYSDEVFNLGTSYNIDIVDKEEVMWASDDESIIKVAQNGKITAVSEGTATVTAKTESGLEAECTVTVNTGKRPVVEGVTVSDISVSYKGTTKIEPDVKYAGAVDYKVEYSSSNESVATVDKDGNVTATGTGEAEITVTVTDEYGNVVEDTCKVTVSYAWWQWLIIIFLFGWIWY